MDKPFEQGDLVLVHQTPQNPLPEDHRHLHSKEGVIKLVLGGEYFKYYVIDVGGELYQLHHSHLIQKPFKVRGIYRILLLDRKQSPQTFKKILWLDKNPTSEDIAQLLKEHKARLARVEHYWEAEYEGEN